MIILAARTMWLRRHQKKWQPSGRFSAEICAEYDSENDRIAGESDESSDEYPSDAEGSILDAQSVFGHDGGASVEEWKPS
jgi:hypothetical protein